VQQQDATGAGDAFFGGLVSGIYKWGLPTNEAEMSRLARVASAHGECPTMYKHDAASN
jgi:sugar/nucleoside kinase (ribokinase family)